MANSTTRQQVLNLYKNLLYLGREYPQGFKYFRDRAHSVFSKNKNVSDPEQIGKLLEFGEYISNELKALYSLKKYRTLKSRYYSSDINSIPSTKFNNISSKSTFKNDS